MWPTWDGDEVCDNNLDKLTDRWENEGGKVLEERWPVNRPKVTVYQDSAPTEATTDLSKDMNRYRENVILAAAKRAACQKPPPTKPMKTIAEFDKTFIDLVVTAVNRTNVVVGLKPDYFREKKQRVGEFVTQLRRIADVHICKADMWYDVGVPQSSFNWSVKYPAIDGEWVMSYDKVKLLSSIALDTTNNDQNAKIAVDLMKLEGQMNGLDLFIKKAQDINLQSDIVIASLHTVAEKLVS